ncbi:MAG: M42 family metallopeptidase [Dethiobacteria bacterium]|jgi:putative aminopeptidase FrvX
MKELIGKLCASFGPAGREEQIRAVIAAEIEKLKEDYFVDTLGNLVVNKGAAGGKKILVAAHMDEIGLMVTYIEKNGYLRFTNLGGIMQQTLPGARIFFENGTVGVIGQEKTKEAPEPGLSKYFLDIGAANREEALTKVKIGDAAVYFAPLHQEGKRLTAKSLDNRVGCAVLLETLRRLSDATLPVEVFFVFTVQEEVGLRGAKTIAYRTKPHYGLAVDVTRVGDTPEPEFKTNVSLGKGPTVKVMDAAVICHPRITSLMMAVAEKNNIPYQPEVLERGGTDAGAIHLSREGIPTGALSIPCRYIHTPAEMVDIDDVENGIALLQEILKCEQW